MFIMFKVQIIRARNGFVIRVDNIHDADKDEYITAKNSTDVGNIIKKLTQELVIPE